MNLEKYRTPASAWAGEWIELPESDGARFLVKLPSAANREWQREVLRMMVAAGVRADEEGNVDAKAVDPQQMVQYREKRLLAFAKLCVIEGPEGFDLEQLTGEFWPALVALYDEAESRAEKEAQEAERAVGESSA